MKYALLGPMFAAANASADERFGQASPNKAATLGFLKEHASIDEIHAIRSDYRRLDQINLLFSNVSPFNPRANDPNDPHFEERKSIRESFGMYVAKADGVIDLLWAAKKDGKSFEAFLGDLATHSVPFPPPVARMLWDNEKLAQAFQRKGGPGWSQLDYAFENAGWAMDHFGARLSEGGVSGRFRYFVGGEMREGLLSWQRPKWPTAYRFESPEHATNAVKKASLFLGADVVGVAPYDPRWVWEKRFNIYDGRHEENQLPFQPKSVIVFGFEMDYEAYKTAPAAIADAAAGICYSKMAATAYSVAEFIRKLGYDAIPCGNDTASSIPLAIQAGLGEGSRMGPMINPIYGPRIRLAKVFTEMELVPDRPVTFGVKEFCMVCKKCANACPSQAISFDDEPSFTVHSCVSNPGVKKWYLKAAQCVQWWGEIGTDCGHCISVCPYNKRDLWHHRVAKLGTHFPFARDFARSLDDAFGYGSLYGSPEQQRCIDEYWQGI
jgi:epoxyqueuosine reductase